MEAFYILTYVLPTVIQVIFFRHEYIPFSLGDIDFIIVSDMPDDKIADVALVNAMLVRASGAIEKISTVPAVRAEDAIKQMQKAQQMASAMAYRAPTQ